MQDTIRSVFESECGHIKFDKHLAKKINAYGIAFTTKNEEHMTFFGGNTLGVQIVRFLPSDRDKWFDMLDINDVSLEEKILELPTVNADFNVSSDVFNHTCMWLIHKFLNSPLLNDKEKHEAMVDCGLVLHYRFMTSFLYHYFHYPADPQVAEATYARLSNKYLIKQYGSWYATLRARCEDLISENGIHYQVLKEYKDDYRIIYLINDTQGRIRDMFKNLFSELLKTQAAGVKISSVSTVVEHDGVSILKDRTKNLHAYTRYLHSIVSDSGSFVKEDLVSVVAKIIHTMNPKHLRETLDWCSKNYRHAGTTVEELIDLTMVHSFGYLQDNRNLLERSNDLPGLISRLRGVYMSSRSTDPELLKLRTVAEKIVKSATTTKNDSAIASVRTGLLCYLVLRAFTMHHYTSH